MTDWSTIVEPQADGSDTSQILSFVDSIRQSSGLGPEPGVGTGLTILKADVRTLDFVPTLDGVLSLEIDSKFTQQVEALLVPWPEYQKQLESLLVAVYPVIEKGATPRPKEIGGSYGTRMKDVAQHFGQVYGTAHTPHGLAAAIVSSMANWKLYSMGIKTKEWDSTLITNTVDQLIPAQVRAAVEMKPVGTVLHAQYALLHLLDWNLHLARFGVLVDWDRWYRFEINQNVNRISRGISSLLSGPQTTDAGAIFMKGLLDWSNRLVEESQEWK